jgi:hypothetical protein
VRSIDARTAEELLEALSLVPFSEGRGFRGALVSWLQCDLRRALTRNDESMDDLLLDALAGSSDAVSQESVSWEGQQYRLDLTAAERRRLRRGARAGRPSIDAAIRLHTRAQRLATQAMPTMEMQATLVEVRQLVTVSTNAGQVLEKAIGNLTATRGSPDVTKVTESLVDLVDVVLGEALISLDYEANLNLAHGGPRAVAAVAGRHDFGLARNDDDARVRAAWAMPKRIVEAGVPWRLEGAALGLDLAAPSLALRRIDPTPPARSPVIDEIERNTFATSVALMDPRVLRNEDLNAIAEAIARGRRRVEALADGDGDANAMAREIAMDGWRVRALRWSLRHEPQRALSWFSMTDLLYLGGGRGVDLNAWGMTAIDVIGCICARLTAPGLWTAFVGRPEPRLLIATVADLNLRVAVALAEMRLPAALAKSVLAMAVQDFVDRAPSLHLDDWLTRVRAAQAVPRERIEDYISAAAVDGPLVPDTSTEESRVP